MRKFDSIPRIGEAQNLLTEGGLWIQEKMDGANFRFTLDDRSAFDSGFIYGSKNVEFHDRENLNGSFEHAVDYVEEHVDPEMLSLYSDEPGDYVVFAEAMHPHTMNYVEEIPNVIGYDVYDTAREQYLAPPKSRLVLDRIGLTVAPYLERSIDAESWDPNAYEFEPSQWATDGDGPDTEGIVIKNGITGARAKYRTDEFKEVHRGSSSKDDTSGLESDSRSIAETFATPERIRKQIYAMRDEGVDVEMEMMPTLWKRVYDDIVEEEYEMILNERWVIDVRELQNEVASITAQVLDSHLSSA